MKVTECVILIIYCIIQILKTTNKGFKFINYELCMFWISIKSIWENFDSSRHFFFYSLNEFSYSTIMTFPSFTGIRSFTRIV